MGETKKITIYRITDGVITESAQIKAEPICLKGWEDFEFVVHKPYEPWLVYADGSPAKKEDHPFKFYIAEKSTGGTIGRGLTKKEAVGSALVTLEENSPKKSDFKKHIEYKLKLINAFNKKAAGCLLDGVEHKEMPR